MDNEQLIKWKKEMESELAEVEKQLSDIEKRRMVLKSKIKAVETLLSPAEQISKFDNYSLRDPVNEFISSLQANGWSIEKLKGKGNNYLVSKGTTRINLWTKFSKLSDITGQYWFGVNPAYLNNENGGIVLILGTHDQYICMPFKKLRDMLEGSKNTKTGQKFQVREKNGRIELQPAGIGGDWIDVTQYTNRKGLERIGLISE